MTSRARTALSVGLGLAIYFGCGYSIAQIPPFFPTEAELEKGLTKTATSGIVACFNVAVVSFNILLNFIARPSRNLSFLVWGAIITSVGISGLGVLGAAPGGWYYGCLCALCEVTIGVGSTMIWCNGLPWLTSLAPSYSGRLISLANSASGVGSILGPIIGSALFGVGGYMYPFLFAGAIVCLAGVTSLIILPTLENRPKLQPDMQIAPEFATERDELLLSPRRTSNDNSLKPSVRQFLSIKGVWAISLLALMGSLPLGFQNATLAPFLVETFNVSGSKIGWFFTARIAMYAASSQFVGLAVDTGYAAHVLFCCSNGTLVLCFLLAAPKYFPVLEQEVYFAILLICYGVILSGTIVPCYLILQRIAVKNGFRFSESNLKLVVGIWTNLTLAVGRILGQILFAGLLYPHFGFYTMCLSAAMLYVVCSTISSLYMSTCDVYPLMRSINR